MHNKNPDDSDNIIHNGTNNGTHKDTCNDKRTAPQTEKSTRKNRRYYFDRMPVGGALTIKANSHKVLKAAINAAYSYGQRSGKIFTIRRSEHVMPDGSVKQKVRIMRFQ